MKACDTPKPQPAPELTLDEAEVDRLCHRLEAGQLEKQDLDSILRYLKLLKKISGILQGQRVRMRRLGRILFGKKTEKDEKKDPPPDGGNSTSSASGGGSDSAPAESASPSVNEKCKTKVKGHGRRPASSYQNAETVHCSICGLKAGDPCPGCQKGHLRTQSEELVIRLKGNPPVTATRYELEKLRCDTCGEIYKAELPAEAGGGKYDASAQASIILNKYGLGMPYYRLGRQQDYLWTPLPASTQWELAEEAANRMLPVYLELERLAARAELLYMDDTWFLIRDEKKRQPLTGIVARWGKRWATLYLAGDEAAGAKLETLLMKRPSGLPPPLRMSDALSGNQLSSFQVIILLCWVHLRRQFFEIRDFYPETCDPVLDAIKNLYKNEAETRRLGWNDQQRLEYHLEHSREPLEQVREWLGEQMRLKLIEPNGPLGKAVNYLNKHWKGLMEFCLHPGAPLDNNVVERALKLPIQSRKNAYFFKTSHGADVGCLLMSLIKTVIQAGANPFHYLETLIRHGAELRQDPGLWLPWNYREQLA
jgi:transposase